MSEVDAVNSGTMPTQAEQPGEQGMVSKERWETIRRLFVGERLGVSEIARRLDLDRKTVRHWAHQEQWAPYSRARRSDTLLGEHEQFVRERAPQVNYSARIVYQELVHRHAFAGSYETVKRAVAPLRQLAGAGGWKGSRRRGGGNCTRSGVGRPWSGHGDGWGRGVVVRS